jgi:DNA-binding NarL/FixJ family response regulator
MVLKGIVEGMGMGMSMSMSEKKVRIVLADDHSIVLEGLRYILKRQEHFEILETASTGISVVEIAERLMPDVVVMDLRMPGLDGITAAERILAKNPAIRIIVLSANISSVSFHRGLKAGILGFVNKESVFGEIIKAIEEVVKGNTYHCLRVRSLMAANLQQILNPKLKKSQELGPEDREIVEMLTNGKSIGEIALSMSKSPKTVDARRRKLMLQLGLSNLAELTKFAISEGITPLELSYS